MQTLRYLSLIICLFMAITILSSCGEKSEIEIPDGFQLASDEAADYHFFIPEHWTVDAKNTSTSAYVSANDPASVSIVTWTLSNTDFTLDEWWEGYLPEFESVYSNFAVTSNENILLDGVAAKKITYTGSLGTTDYKFTQTAAIRDSIIYVLTYTSTAERFDEHTEDLDSIIEYFEFK